MARRQIQRGYVLAIAIARTLAERDPGFLKALRSNLVEIQQTQPRGETTWETLSIFLAAMDDPQIFPQ
jgi:hypothetical protein